MHPILWEFTWRNHHHTIRSYQAMLLLAFLATWIVGTWLQRRTKIPMGKGFAAIGLSLIALYSGARLSYGLLQRLDENAVTVEGLWLPGGVLFAGVVLVVCCRVLTLDLAEFTDHLVPALGLGGAILRTGCFLQGCCFGIPTSLPWGVAFPWGSPAHLAQTQQRIEVLFFGPLPVHPTQLYELLAFLVMAGIGVWGLRSRLRGGTTALLAIAWFSVFRAGNALLRAPDPLMASSQIGTIVVSLGTLAVCLFALYRRSCSKVSQKLAVSGPGHPTST